jgi:hypothetical protein
MKEKKLTVPFSLPSAVARKLLEMLPGRFFWHFPSERIVQFGSPRLSAIPA